MGFAIYPKHGKFAAGQDFYVLSCITSFTVPCVALLCLSNSNQLNSEQKVQVCDTTEA